MTYESALERLNEITSQMEDPEITLKNAVDLYAEAKKLIEFCTKCIDEAKLEVEKIEE